MRLDNLWTNADDKFLKDNYANNSNINIGKALRRTQKAVSTRAKMLGLKKSKEFILNNIRKAQSQSVANNRKTITKEEKLARNREYRRKHYAWLKENNPEQYERMLAKSRGANRKYYKRKVENEEI